MVERLYLTDSHLMEWDAEIVGIIKRQCKTFVELDRTAFRPQGGGQPGDTGTIKTKNFDIRVIDTIEEGDRILHQVDRLEEEGPARCTLDYKRRERFMYLHSGEHVLFRSLQLEIPDLKVSKINIGEGGGKLFVCGEVDWDEVARAEQTTNRIISENRRVKIHLFSTIGEAKEKLPQARIKEEKVKGKPRFVEIENFDCSACCGTHVSSTGEIGSLKVFRLSRAGKETCIEYDVGLTAASKAFALSNTALRAAGVLGTEPDKLVGTIENLKMENEKLRSVIKTYSAAASSQKLEELRNSPKKIHGNRLFSAELPGIDQRDVIGLAKTLQSETKSAVVMIGGIEKLIIVCSRSKDLEIDMRPVANAVVAVLGGGAGGRPDFVTGSGINSEKISEALAAGEAEITRLFSEL